MAAHGSSSLISPRNSLTMTALSRPLRERVRVVPKKSSKIEVRVNHFQVTFNRKQFPDVMYHYDVNIKNDEREVTRTVDRRKDAGVLPDRLVALIFATFIDQNKDVLNMSTPFDGKKNFYTPRRLVLPNGDAYCSSLRMKDPDDPVKIRQFYVEIKLVAEVKTDAMWMFLQSGVEDGYHVITPQDVIQGLDVALRDAPSRKFISCNRSFFSPISRYSLDSILELLFGHYQSLFLGDDGMATLNVDLATKAFYKPMSLEKYVRLVCGINLDSPFDNNLFKNNPNLFNRVNNALKGKLIQYGSGRLNNGEYANYHRFTANGLQKDSESAVSYKFRPNQESVKDITIEDYFRQKGTFLKHPEFPVVHIGNMTKTNFVPLELCSIISQPYKGKMENALTSEMIKGSAQPPEARFQNIIKSRKGCEFESCQVLKDFGMEVGNTMLEITDAYRLHVPTIKTRLRSSNDVNNSTHVHPKEGKWGYNANAGDRYRPEPAREFQDGAAVPQFAVLDCVGVQRSKIVEFLQQLARTGESHGMKDFVTRANCAQIIAYTNYLKPGDRSRSRGYSRVVVRQDVLNTCLKELKDKNYKLVIVIISRDGTEYPIVKAEAEVKIGILTACIKEKNVNFVKSQTLINYLLKLNSKLNGVNFAVEELQTEYFNMPVIIMGADVTHPSPNSKAPSIAAVTASFNRSMMSYDMTIEAQDSRQELIVNMENIMENFLKNFHIKNDRWPQKIIMFRDGVSEGYFDEVKREEYGAIRRVCDRIIPNLGRNPVKITFVIVKKRHHTRFQAMNPEEAVGRFNNVPPGTVVDTKIIHPVEQEFFLNSHVGIQGTSKPTRYHVIHDDSKFTSGQMTRLTYFLCYGFVRCTQPVSYPAPTYYAHLAAYRARNLLEKEGENADLDQLRRQLTIHPDLLNNYPMFFV